MKNSPNQHCCQIGVADDTFVDGHNYTNAYGTASFPPEGRGKLILIVDGATSTIF